MVAQDEPLEVARRFEAIPTDTIFDVLETRGLARACCLRLDIGPLQPGRPRAGRAFTWRMVSDPRHRDDWNPPGLETVGAHFEGIVPGDMIVVDSGGDAAAGDWGEMLSIMARNRGARGAVVDGGTRDSAAIRRLEDWNVFARYTSPIESMGRRRVHDVQGPLALAGALGDTVVVQPGDWIVADDDSVLVVPAEVSLEVLQAAEALELVEEEARNALLGGEDPDSVFDRFGRA